MHINRIDRTPPTAVSLFYVPKVSTAGSVEVTLALDSVVAPIVGWEGGTGQLFTRTYATNISDTVQFFDLAGNVGSTGILIDWIEHPNKEYGYVGSPQTFIAPESGWYQIQLRGAGGGKALVNNSLWDNAGYGGYTNGMLYLAADEELYIYVGAQGNDGKYFSDSPNAWNGGGKGTWDKNDDETSGGGGGATDVRLVSGAWDNATSLASRIMVAGAGGGASFTFTGGNAGGLTGFFGAKANNAGYYSSTYCAGTQTGGYAFGKGQDGTGEANSDGVAGGGGGYWGGCTQNVLQASAGAGGSSFISGYTGAVAILSASSTSPKS